MGIANKHRDIIPIIEKAETGYLIGMGCPDKHEQTVLDCLEAIGVDVVSIAITRRKYNGENEEYCDAIDITPAAAIAYLQMVEKILKDRFPFPATDESGPRHYVERGTTYVSLVDNEDTRPAVTYSIVFSKKRYAELANTFLPPYLRSN